MAYKTIATVLHDPAAPAQTLDFAVAAARTWGADLHVLCAGVDTTEPGIYYAGAQALAVQENLEYAQSQAEAVTAYAHAHLATQDIAYDIQTARLMLDGLTSYLSDQLRFYDLVILPRPYVTTSKRADVLILEAVLFGANRPVLVIPPDQKAAPTFDRILVAWDDGNEALSACRAAVPLMEIANATTITIIDPPIHSAERSDPGGRLGAYLSSHGVRADINVQPRKMPRLADQLAQNARDQGADLIVMGAYGHARIREALFGGVTREMLQTATTPILMAH